MLSLRGFVEACRALSTAHGILTPELVSTIQGAPVNGTSNGISAPRDANSTGGVGGHGMEQQSTLLHDAEARRVLLAGMYLEFDDDASGGGARDDDALSW